MRRWDLVTLLLLLFTAIVTPVEVAFMETVLWSVLFLINRSVDCLFIFDIFLNFFVAIVDPEDGQLVFHHPTIVKEYLRGWFWIDVISVMPFDLVSLVFASDGVGKLKILRVLRLLRLMKLLRILRAGRIFQRLETQYHSTTPSSNSSSSASWPWSPRTGWRVCGVSWRIWRTRSSTGCITRRSTPTWSRGSSSRGKTRVGSCRRWNLRRRVLLVVDDNDHHRVRRHRAEHLARTRFRVHNDARRRVRVRLHHRRRGERDHAGEREKEQVLRADGRVELVPGRRQAGPGAAHPAARVLQVQDGQHERPSAHRALKADVPGAARGDHAVYEHVDHEGGLLQPVSRGAHHRAHALDKAVDVSAAGKDSRARGLLRQDVHRTKRRGYLPSEDRHHQSSILHRVSFQREQGHLPSARGDVLRFVLHRRASWWRRWPTSRT